MSRLILGMQCMQDDSLARDPVKQARVADLIVDPRWAYRFKLITIGYLPLSAPEPQFVGQVPAARLRDSALQALSSPSAADALFSISKKDEGADAHFNVGTGRQVLPNWPNRSNAAWRVPENVDVDAAAAAWVELQHDIVATLGVSHAVIVTATNEWVLNAEIWLSLTSIDGKVMHPRPEEITAYATNKQLIGNQYIRKPRWGTYLKPAHVAAVGGRDHLLAVVKPPVVRDVGDLLYVQLSERVSDATSEDTKARYRAFTELVAPITIPM